MGNLKKKIIGFVIMTMVTAASVSGCAGNSAGGGKKMLFCTYDLTDTFNAMLADGVSKAGSNAGISVDVYDGEASVTDQVNKVKKAKSEGYSAVIIRPVDASTALQIEVAAGDLPVVFINSQPDDSVLKKDKYVFAGSTETEAGELQAQWVLKKLNNPKSLNVVILKGEPGHAGTIGRTKAVKYTLKDAGVDANYVFVDYANWDTAKAASKIKTFLKTDQPYDVFFCNNDGMALGVIEALKNAGINPADVPICGVDATADGCAAIKAGEMSFTAMQNAEGQATAAIKAAMAMTKGQSITSLEGASSDGKYILVPFESVDSSNVSNYSK